MTTDTQKIREASARILDEAHERAKTLPANTVQVWPGGAKFTTIQDAVNSIQGAGPQLQYQVAIGPGLYYERVTLTPYIFLSGAGTDQTKLISSGDLHPVGTLNTAAECGAGRMLIAAKGVPGNGFVCPVYITGGHFDASGLELDADDVGYVGNQVFGIADRGAAQPGTVHVGKCTIQIGSSSDQSSTVGICTEIPSSTYGISMCTIDAQRSGGIGVICDNQATATIDNTVITGQNWTLWNVDGQSAITATTCTLNGPVSAGVTVEP